ncbi:MAG: hypothetical protein MJY86_04710 [Bacteroidales bacterium]|nr:hypothetical protein [Bacteroidales bacterium]
MRNNYSILINTCDSFEDCWDPFFKLFTSFWSDCSGSVYLNTEFKDYSYPGMSIIPVRNTEGRGLARATWSQCLRWALESICDDVILYMQEDYFLKAKVKNDLVEQYVDLMYSDDKIKCIHLTDQSVESDAKSEFDNLDIVIRKQRYRVSCQAALWRKEELLSLIRDYESAWEFEEYGSKRSAVMGHLYLAVSHSFVVLDEFEIVPYIFTGIVKGRWYEPTKDLFERNGIEMDWSSRGFIGDAPSKPLGDRIIYRLRKIPKSIRSFFEVLALKLHKI